MRYTSKNILISSLIMFLTYGTIWLLKLGLTMAGAEVSSLNGEIIISALSFRINSETWDLLSVLSIYLFPILILSMLTFIIGRRYHYPIKLTRTMVLVKSWLFIFLIIEAFLLPFTGILDKTGFWHALSWLNISRVEQYVLSLVFLLLFLFGSSKSGPFFAAAIELKDVVVYKKKPIVDQVLSLIIVPAVGLLVFMVSFSYSYIGLTEITFITGFVFTIGFTVWQVLGYDVIVR